jgi:hypothetical protein
MLTKVQAVNAESELVLPNIAIFSGNANPELAHRIARRLTLPLAKIQVGRFSDGEVNVEILENIRGRDIFIVQSTCPPVNDNLMELLVMADACRRASATRITAVMPYFGYARQDRRPRAARAYHRAPGRWHDLGLWHRPVADGGFACGPDPGLFLDSGR